MATTESTVGMDHLTVVPENFVETEGTDDETESDEADAHRRIDD